MNVTHIDAANFAKARHGAKGQMYSGHTYDFHLEQVADVLAEFGYATPPYRDAAWLHATVEDTDTAIEEITQRYGVMCGKLVWAVTGVGINRRQRNEDIYRKLRLEPDACPLKAADRIVNHKTTLDDKSDHHAEMYLGERLAFEEAMHGYIPDAMWLRLQEQYDALEAFVNR